MSSIPEDLFHGILLRLPVKSLLACKCVCKNWNALISNPSFVVAQVNHSTRRNSFISLTRKRNERIGYKYAVHSISYESLSSYLESNQDDVDDMLFKGGLIFSSTSKTSIDLLCSCNGLVCLNFRSHDYKGRGISQIWNLLLWNPATREYKKLPKGPSSREFVQFYRCALGYDDNINDYKLVTLLQLDSWTYNILVYTLGLNSWKTINTLSYTIEEQSGLLFNGAFHWLGIPNKGDRSRCIISFGMSNERSYDIQLPKEALDEGWCASMGVLEGYLCVVEKRHRRAEVVVLWVMQKYGVRESWTKRYVINHKKIQENSRLMWYSKNCEIIFTISGNRHLVIYDPKQGSVREPKFQDFHVTEYGESYFETLVSLNSGMYVGENGEIEFSIEDEEEDEYSSEYDYED